MSTVERPDEMVKTERRQTFEPRPWMMHPIDPNGPGPGPWDDEPDEVTWTDGATGVRCMAKRPYSGTWCGYVLVGRSHPFLGKDYTDDEVQQLDVHGEVTFGGSWFDEGDWWLGFDTNHGGDYGPMTAMVDRKYGAHSILLGGRSWTYRTLAFVQKECAALALQIVNLPDEEDS